ncbi:MAG: methyltransferase domain-containing protein [Gammaproteobacteria bacterium]|nr:methyltransferase domain-containing protein [Gammaproteobacteria bacterium]
MATTPTDYRAITERQQAMWATGDYHEIARQMMSASDALCTALDLHAGQRVLDVACGSGNTALSAARRYCEVTGIDYVPALLERAKARAAAEGVTVDFRVADAQALPFADASFDVVLSVFGVMFAPDQERAARELLRVCRPGGKIGLVCWMPEAFGGEFFTVHARYLPAPPEVKPAIRWGTAVGLDELLRAGVSSMQHERRSLFEYYRSTDHAVDVFRAYFGPTRWALEKSDAQTQTDLHRDLAAVFNRYNRATDGTMMLEAEYLQTIATRSSR